MCVVHAYYKQIEADRVHDLQGAPNLTARQFLAATTIV